MNLTERCDGELASMFAETGDDAAFEELVSRHSAMVYRTCRRVSGDHQSAEDAMQQVFATLAQRSAVLGSYRSLGGWLYSTAWHVARQLRRAQLARSRRERRVAEREAAEAAVAPDADVLEELFRSIEMLPAEYRDAIVLHHLEGFTVQQVAEILDCATGTAASRLSRGRSIIRERLGRRGIALCASTIEAALIAEVMERDCVPAVASPAYLRELALDSVSGAGSFTTTAEATHWAGGASAVATTAAAKTVVHFAGLKLLSLGSACSIAVAAAAVTSVASYVTYQKGAGVIHQSGSSEKTASNRNAGSDSVSTSSDSGYSHSHDTWYVPEPSSLAILAVTAGVMSLRRRRTSLERGS